MQLIFNLDDLFLFRSLHLIAFARGWFHSFINDFIIYSRFPNSFRFGRFLCSTRIRTTFIQPYKLWFKVFKNQGHNKGSLLPNMAQNRVFCLLAAPETKSYQIFHSRSLCWIQNERLSRWLHSRWHCFGLILRRRVESLETSLHSLNFPRELTFFLFFTTLLTRILLNFYKTTHRVTSLCIHTETKKKKKLFVFFTGVEKSENRKKNPFKVFL